MKVLRYLRYTSNYRLYYAKYLAMLKGYKDVNWISDTKNSNPPTDMSLLLEELQFHGNLIARSTMESEFIALDKAREKAEWLWNFLKDISNQPKHVPLIYIHCSCQSAIGKAQNTLYSSKS